jgi:enoyl-CoA hydratase/carnithine racemase
MNRLILTTQQNGVLTVQLNRPTKKNALTNAMYLELIKQFNFASSQNDIHCLLIYGDQHCFTAGNDLQDFLQLAKDELAALAFIEVLANFKKPLIAAVAGAAVGIGTTLLLHCDMVLAADNSKFQLPFTQLGLCPEAGSSLLLTAKVGANKAFELLVLGKPFNAEQALTYGIINQICSTEQLYSTALDLAQAIAALPSDAVLTSRQLIRHANTSMLSKTMKLEADQFLRLVQTEQCKSILAKFFTDK